MRLKNYLQTKNKVRDFNMKQSHTEGYKLRINKFADWTAEERERMVMKSVPILKPQNSDSSSSSNSQSTIESSHIATTLSWQAFNLGIRDQGHCGSCWAFATVAAVESILAIKELNKNEEYLSVQQLIDCDYKAEVNMGCDGGNPQVALEYI